MIPVTSIAENCSTEVTHERISRDDFFVLVQLTSVVALYTFVIIFASFVTVSETYLSPFLANIAFLFVFCLIY